MDVSMLITGLTIFALAVFVGFEIITKIPPTLHTPLMSGSNAISGITIVGALVAIGNSGYAMATVFGFHRPGDGDDQCRRCGFLVTNRMLKMFRRKKK